LDTAWSPAFLSSKDEGITATFASGLRIHMGIVSLLGATAVSVWQAI
jgi:hypothetical protein